MMTLWHCGASRSIRPLWLLEELGLKPDQDYQLITMPFPPRLMQSGYSDQNPVGTVPFFTDGDVRMTESVAICQYIAEKLQATDLLVSPQSSHYGDYLNWLYRSDATLTFPQTLILRYSKFEPVQRQLPQAVEDYTQWFFARLRTVEIAVEKQQFLVDNRFTIADIAVGFALYLADLLGLSQHFKSNTLAYYQRLQARAAFQSAIAVHHPSQAKLF